MARFHFCSLLAVIIVNVWLLSQVNGEKNGGLKHNELWRHGQLSPFTAENITAYIANRECHFTTFHSDSTHQYYECKVSNREPVICDKYCVQRCGSVPIELAVISGHDDPTKPNAIREYNCICRASKPPVHWWVTGDKP